MRIFGLSITTILVILLIWWQWRRNWSLFAAGARLGQAIMANPFLFLGAIIGIILMAWGFRFLFPMAIDQVVLAWDEVVLTRDDPVGEKVAVEVEKVDDSLGTNLFNPDTVQTDQPQSLPVPTSTPTTSNSLPQSATPGERRGECMYSKLCGNRWVFPGSCTPCTPP